MEIKFPEFNLDAVTAIKKLPTRMFVPAGEGGPLWRIPDDLAPQAAKLLAPFFPELAEDMVEEFSEEAEATDILIDIQRAGSIEDIDTEKSAALVLDIVSRLNLPEGESLYKFQDIGVAFIELTKGRTLLGDEMGLGKSIMTLAWLSLHPEYRPVVAFVPGKLRVNWKRFVNTWLPNDTVQVISTGKDTVDGADITITSYELASKHKTAILELKPVVVILDECTKVANKKAQRTKATLEIARAAEYKIGISGTPIRNRTAEFFNILNLLRPGAFPKFFSFAIKYCDGWKDDFGWNFSGSSNEEELSEAVRHIMIRRLKKDVLDLPIKRREPIVVNLSPAMATLYNDAEAELRDSIQVFKAYKKETKGRNLSEEYRRYLADFDFGSYGYEQPASYKEFTWDTAYAELGQDRMIAIAKINLMRQIVGQGKAELVYDIAEDFLNAGEKLVIFGHHKKVLNTIESDFSENGVRTVRIDGDSTDRDVEEAEELFQNDPDVPVLLGSTLAAGVGFTLTAASNALVVERQWTPSDEVQAEDRLHRIGQTESVTAWYLVVQNTVDDRMNLIVENKRKRIGMVIDNEKAEEIMSQSILGEVMREMGL